MFNDQICSTDEDLEKLKERLFAAVEHCQIIRAQRTHLLIKHGSIDAASHGPAQSGSYPVPG